jgi:hypothetical protein
MFLSEKCLESSKRQSQNHRFAEPTKDEQKFILEIQKTFVSSRDLDLSGKSSNEFLATNHSLDHCDAKYRFVKAKTLKVWRPNAYAKDYINTTLRIALTNPWNFDSFPIIKL